MFMIREVFQAQRGKVPELLSALKGLDQWFEQAGIANRRLYVDFDGPMDTVVYQFEVESLDAMYTMERGAYVNPDPDSQALIDAFNSNATAGRKEIYEVIQ
jgi:hypothetical protein